MFIPFPNFIIGVVLGVISTDWLTLFISCLGWGFVFLIIRSITGTEDKIAFIQKGYQGKKLGISKGVWFSIIELWTGFSTSLLFGTIVYFIIKMFK